MKSSLSTILFLATLCTCSFALGAQYESLSVLDKDHLIVHILDGIVTHPENGDLDRVTRYTPALNTNTAITTTNWSISSSDDDNYATEQHPTQCYRKTKTNGQAQLNWSGNDYVYEYTVEHWIFLKLPNPMQQGDTYTLTISNTTNVTHDPIPITFNIFEQRSPAIHTNVVGYIADTPHKAADLYFWMGDGGARNYDSFLGKKVYIYDITNAVSAEVGSVTFWKTNTGDVFNYNLTRSDIWNIDFSNITIPGVYRLVVEDVGCSDVFFIDNNVYHDPFEVSVLGFYYMRIGQEAGDISPGPRTPLYIPGVDPINTTVYLTSMHPYHEEWDTFASGDNWDRKSEWAAYKLDDNPTNDDAWGGHSDAADWDRHLGHISIIWDMLLPYILSQGAISDDDLGISESGNGIPDIIDEAAYEVDFWLRLRDLDGGYSHGLNNPDSNNVFYQAAGNAISAWANAANAAMLAEAFRLAGINESMNHYLDEATTAYNYANNLSDQMLDTVHEIGYDSIRGRDMKMMAAAYLYNLTGNTIYEDVINDESVCTSATSSLGDNSSFNQIWASLAYLTTPQTVHYPTLQNNMKASFIYDAKQQEANHITSRPSRRATHNTPGYFRTSQNVHRTIVAHAISDNDNDRDFFLKALALEADWGLGRNPLNMIHMSLSTTTLEHEKGAWYIYSPNTEDGIAGSFPGQTPYMNLYDWGSMVMAKPSALYANCYPDNFMNTWPIGEGYFDTPWSWAHSEFTPQQTMRGKMALYGYLYSLSKNVIPHDPHLSIYRNGKGSGTISSTPHGINCGDTCSTSFPSNTQIVLEATPDSNSTFIGWNGASCTGTSTCTINLNAPVLVTATFDIYCNNNTDCNDNDDCTSDVCDSTTHSCSNEYIAYCGMSTDLQLTITKSGNGNGLIYSVPDGIDCGDTCSMILSGGNQITLVAIPDEDSTFATWNGSGCTGNGTCTLSVNTSSVIDAVFSLRTDSSDHEDEEDTGGCSTSNHKIPYGFFLIAFFLIILRKKARTIKLS